MRRILVALSVLLMAGSSVNATGMLIPVEKALPPLALLDHKVTVTLDDQAAITRIEQTFRNHTPRQLEATYLFPVPKGASVRKFTMWVNGKEEPGEVVEAEAARKIYTDIVARTQDPGLLEYINQALIKVRVFPVPGHMATVPHRSVDLHERRRPRQRTDRIRLPDEGRGASCHAARKVFTLRHGEVPALPHQRLFAESFDHHRPAQ